MAEAASDDQQVLNGSSNKHNKDDINTLTEEPLDDHKHFKSQRQTSDEPAKSAKRRCISTACLACRRRKSKAGLPSYLFRVWRRNTLMLTDARFNSSATATHLAVQHVLRSMAPNVSTTPIQITAGKAYTKRTLTISRRVIQPCRP